MLTVSRLCRMAYGFSSRRFWTVSNTCSCSQRAIRRCTPVVQRAVATCIRPVAPQPLPVLLVRVVVLELLAGRTAIDILVSEIDEVLLAETALCLNAGCHRLWKRHRDAGPITGEDLLAAEVAAIGNGLELIDAENILYLRGDVAQLCPIRAAICDFMRHNQMMLYIDRHLHVVADHTGATPAR